MTKRERLRTAKNRLKKPMTDLERDIYALVIIGYSIPLIAEIVQLSEPIVKNIVLSLGGKGLTNWRRRQFEDEDPDMKTTWIDIELESQRGTTRRGGWLKTPIYYAADGPMATHGDIKVYRPGPDGKLQLVEVIPYRKDQTDNR